MFLNRIFIAKRKSTQSMHLNAGGRPCRLKPPQRAFLTMARLGAGSKEQSILETAVACAVATFTMEYCRAASNCLNPLQSDHLTPAVWLVCGCFMWGQFALFDMCCFSLRGLMSDVSTVGQPWRESDRSRDVQKVWWQFTVAIHEFTIIYGIHPFAIQMCTLNELRFV